MALIDINWRPDRTELRRFGWLSAVIFGALGAWIRLRHSFVGFELAPSSASIASYVLWAVAALSTLGSIVAPQMLRVLYVTLMAISLPIGFVVSHVLMAAIFYGIFTPVGLVFRLFGRDALHRAMDRSAGTYWQPRATVTDKQRYFRQF